MASHRTTLYKCDDLDAFRTHMQTLIIKDYPDVPDGEYYLAFPDEEPGYDNLYTEYDLENGFYATADTYYIGGDVLVLHAAWHVTYGSTTIVDEDGNDMGDKLGEYSGINKFFTYLTIDEKEDTAFVTNVRYNSYEGVVYWYDNYGNKIVQQVYVGCRSGQYCCETYNTVTEISTSFSSILICTLTVVPLATVAACSVAFAVKRKKQKYGF